MAGTKMPRRFWSYTAGKGDPLAEEHEAIFQRKVQEVKQSLPGFLAFGFVLLLLLIMLLMMFAEFRGFYLDQIGELFRVR